MESRRRLPNRRPAAITSRLAPTRPTRTPRFLLRCAWARVRVRCRGPRDPPRDGVVETQLVPKAVAVREMLGLQTITSSVEMTPPIYRCRTRVEAGRASGDPRTLLLCKADWRGSEGGALGVKYWYARNDRTKPHRSTRRVLAAARSTSASHIQARLTRPPSRTCAGIWQPRALTATHCVSQQLPSPSSVAPLAIR